MGSGNEGASLAFSRTRVCIVLTGGKEGASVGWKKRKTPKRKKKKARILGNVNGTENETSLREKGRGGGGER